MQIDDAVSALGALAQKTRLDVFRLLLKESPDGIAAGEIAQELGIVASTLSHHLGLMESASLVQSRREGRRIVYSANLSGARRLIAFLTEDCCGGHPDLCRDLGVEKFLAEADDAHQASCG